MPCKDCPWKRNSLPGWLGTDNDVQDWLKIAHGDDVVDCHNDTKKQCHGMSIYRASVCKRPRNLNAMISPHNREDVFSNPMEFKTHHEKFGKTSASLKDG